jgi:hypothetical protein
MDADVDDRSQILQSHNPSYTPPPSPRLPNMTLNAVTSENLASKNRAQQAPSRLVPEPFREFASDDIKMMRHARLTR